MCSILRIVAILILFNINNSLAEEACVKIYQTDKYGNKLYNMPSTVIQGNEIYQVDKYGNVQYNKPGGKIEDAVITPTDKYRNELNNSPKKKIEKSK